MIAMGAIKVFIDDVFGGNLANNFIAFVIQINGIILYYGTFHY